MNEQVLTQNAVVESSTGGAIIVRPGEAAVAVKAGMNLLVNDILLTPKTAEVVVKINGQLVMVDKNCVACLAEATTDNQEYDLQSAQVLGDVSVNPDVLTSELPPLEGLDIADIQAAILDGVDPTLALEATAAGGQGATSANGGFVTIDYTYVETLASTFFQTQGFERQAVVDDDDPLLFVPAEGGQIATSFVTEGNIDSATAIQSTVTTVNVAAGNRPLDSTSFSFDATQLASLLAELNSEITSSGEPVVFSFDEVSNSILGVQGGNTVVSFVLTANAAGTDVELSLTTTVNQPIDHNVTTGSTGLVRFTDNNIAIDVSIQGQDINGNALLSPVLLTPNIIDGQNQSTNPVDIEYTETSELSAQNPVQFEGSAISIGSDYLQDIRFEESAISLFDTVLTNNQAVEAVLSDDGRTLTVFVTGEPDNVVFEAKIDTDGNYSITQYQVVEQTNDNADELLLALPIISTDFDGDVVRNTLNYTVLDGTGPSSVGEPDDVEWTETVQLDGTAGNAISQTESVEFIAGTDNIESVEWQLSAEHESLLNNLTSNGNATTWVLSDDKTRIEVVVEGTTDLVLSLDINSDKSGEYTVTQYSAFDHVGTNDQFEFSPEIVAIDTDGDSVSRTVDILIADGSDSVFDPTDITLNDDVLGTESDKLPLGITQGSDIIDSITFSGTNADLTALEGLTSNGNSTSVSITDDGKTLNVMDGSQLVLSISIQQESDASKSTYTITQHAAIDQLVDGNPVNSLLVDVPIIITDSDGDETKNNIEVTLTDGNNVAFLPDNVVLNDDSNNPIVKSLGIEQGHSDAVTSITFSSDAELVPELLSLTSNGKPTTVVVEDDGKVLKVMDGNNLVLSVSLQQSGDDALSTYTITQHAAIDQLINGQPVDSLTVNIPVLIKDSDGDETKNNINVSLEDGTDVAFAPESVLLNDDSNSPVEKLLGIDADHSDAVKNITFSELTSDLSELEALTSNGNPTTVVVEDNGKTLKVMDGSDAVLTITLHQNADDGLSSYTITQHAAIDQLVNGQPVDSLSVNVAVVIEDTDGDKTKNTINVGLVDGNNVVFTPESVVVNDDSNNPITKSLGIDPDHSDVVTSIVFSAEVKQIVESLSLTSNGKATTVVVEDGGKTLKVMEGASMVLSVSIQQSTDDSDSTYTITQHQPIDQATSGSDIGSILVDLPVLIKDSDGDTTKNNIAVTLNDGKDPVIAPIVNVTLDESGIDKVKGQVQEGSASHLDSEEGSTKIVVNQNADNIDSFSIDLTELNRLADIDPIFSAGKEVQFIEVSPGNYQGVTYKNNGTIKDVVININVNNDSTSADFGKVEFELLQAVKHGNDTDGKNLQLEFVVPVIATDTDGDKATNNFNVVIVDDVPVIEAGQQIELMESSTRNHAINLFKAVDDDGDGKFDNHRGADSGTIETVRSIDSDITLTLDSTSNNGNTENYIVSFQNQQIGVLTVKSNGYVAYKGNGNDIAEKDDGLTIPLEFTAIDKDGDTSTGVVNVVIKDNNSTIHEISASGTEDAGRNSGTVSENVVNDNDNVQGDNAPIKVNFSLDVGDIDSNESLASFKVADNGNGAFYYKSGNDYIAVNGELLASDMQTSTNEQTHILSLDNLYFIPKNDTSSRNKGFAYRVEAVVTRETDTTATTTETVKGTLRVVVEGIADTPTWSASTDFETVVMGSEDSTNIALDIKATTQDRGSESISYVIVFKDGNLESHTLELSDGTELTLSNITLPDGTSVMGYEVTSSEISKLELNPADEFSGKIALDVIAISTENSNRHVLNGSEQAFTSETLEIDVIPVADQADLVVSRVNVDEDTAFKTSDHITVDITGDNDGSEHITIELLELPVGSVISYMEGVVQVQLLISNDGSAVKVGSGEQVDLLFSYDVIKDPNTTITPPKDSNVDFNFKVKATVDDKADLHTNPNEVDSNDSIPVQTIHVDIKGIADEAKITGGNGWETVTTTDANTGLVTTTGIKTTINENKSAKLDFTVESGEIINAADKSETISVVLIDAGGNLGQYQVVDSATGTEVNLTYVGTENGHPKYEANISGASIEIIPSGDTTDDIHLIAKIVVTEDDGNVRIDQKDIFIDVIPVIDGLDDNTSSYVNSSRGFEDSPFNINWYPKNSNLSDESTAKDNEFISSVVLKNGPANVNVQIALSSDYVVETSNGVSVPNDGTHYIFSAGTSVIIKSTGSTPLTADNLVVQVQTPEDSSINFQLDTVLTVKEIDVDQGQDAQLDQVESTINGTVNVVVASVVESDANLVTMPIESENLIKHSDFYESKGDLSFSINDNDPLADVSIKFEDLDSSSDEKVSQIVLDFGFGPQISVEEAHLLDQLYIKGAVNNGDGTWTVTDESDFSISAPNGLYTQADPNTPVVLDVNIKAQVVDLGDESDPSALTQKSTTLKVSFPDPDPNNSVDSLATFAEFDPQTVIGTEDSVVKLGSELTKDGVLIFQDALPSPSSTDNVSYDVVTIVFDLSAEPFSSMPGLSISGGETNFDNGKTAITIETSLNANGTIPADALDSLMLTLPENYSGDFNLPATVVVTDTQSGDETVTSINIPIQVSAVVDVPTNVGDVELDLVVDDTVDYRTGEKAPENPVSNTAYEDGTINLDLSIGLLDKSSSVLTGGVESLETVTISLDDSALGSLGFVNGLDGYGSGAISVTSSPDGVVIDATKLDSGHTIESVLKDLQFTPVNDLGGVTVSLNVSGVIVDSTAFDLDNSGDSTVDSVSKSANVDLGQVSFDIEAIIDGVASTNADGSLNTISVVGEEDTPIALNNLGLQLDDSDGSEQFVSIKITNVPADFLLQVKGEYESDFSVRNNGNGEWSIQLKGSNINASSLDMTGIEIVPAEDFAGTVDLQYIVYTKEESIQNPNDGQTGAIKVTIEPKADELDSRISTTSAGKEGVDIELAINATTTDNQVSLDPASGDFNYQENDVEKIEITVSGVPDGASISLNGADSVVNNNDGTWTIVADSPVEKIVFNSGDWNNSNWNEFKADLAQPQLNITVKPVDSLTTTDPVSGDQSVSVNYGTETSVTVNLDITEVNDKPVIELTDPNIFGTKEDTPFTITDIQIKDPDSKDGVDSESYVFTLSITNASVSFTNQPDWVTFDSVSGNYLLTNSVASINALLTSGVIITPDENFYGDIDVELKLYDGGNFGESTGEEDHHATPIAFTIPVSAVNDAPENQVFDQITVDEGSQTKLTGLAISDVDYSSLPDTVQVTVTLTVDSGQLSANLPTGTTSVSIDNSDTSQLVIKGPYAEVNALLTSTDTNKGVFYTVSGDNDYTSATLTMVTNDGGNYDAVSTAELTDTDTASIVITPTVSGIPELQLALQAQQIRTTVSGALAAIGIPLIGLNASLANSMELDSENVVIRISGLPDTATITATNATLVNSEWFIPADQLDTAEVHGLMSTTTLNIAAVAKEEGALDVVSTATSVNIQVNADVADHTIDGSTESTAILAVGGDDNDIITGSAFDDILVGGDGNDLINGGLGADELTGGAGSDQFIWTESDLDSSGIDVIKDFSLVEHDVIDLVSLLDDDTNGSITTEDLLGHIQASVVDHDPTHTSKDVKLDIIDDSSEVKQTIIIEGLGDNFGSSTDLLTDLIGEGVFKVDL